MQNSQPWLPYTHGQQKQMPWVVFIAKTNIHIFMSQKNKEVINLRVGGIWGTYGREAERGWREEREWRKWHNSIQLKMFLKNKTKTKNKPKNLMIRACEMDQQVRVLVVEMWTPYFKFLASMETFGYGQAYAYNLGAIGAQDMRITGFSVSQSSSRLSKKTILKE